MVYLIGAGPGDPGLITVKGLAALRRADVVLYDRLSSPELLKEAPEGAKLIDVGKRPRDPNQPSQTWINELLVDHSRASQVVVRLKGGDPYVYGRGSEELAALRDAGIEAEVIPGVTSAIAAPSAAGIPVTHRGLANAFGVFTGHEANEDGDTIPWVAAAALPTAIFLMGVEKLPRIVSQLLAHGRAADTPVAIVSRGTLPDQVVVKATLETIIAASEGVSAPAVIVVGDVASFAEITGGSV